VLIVAPQCVQPAGQLVDQRCITVGHHVGGAQVFDFPPRSESHFRSLDSPPLDFVDADETG
jgi:hypothetical protein